ncbi:MAG TPA: dipeptide epimerase [Ktedonobacterales bacterium]
MARTARIRTHVLRLEAQTLDIPLLEPFTIATGAVDTARNILVRVTLTDGTVGLGEGAPFPPSGGETQETALAAALGMAPLVEGADAAEWRPLAGRLLANFEHQATARAAVEAAVLDAVTRSWGIPLYQFFGGMSKEVESDISIPIVTPEHIVTLARKHVASGARTIKLKVGTTVDGDLARVRALREAAPEANILLDGNQGFTPVTALQLLDALRHAEIVPILFEQPVHRHDLEGLRFVTERAGIPVAADEAVHTAADALRIARMGAANVINIKVMKSGLVEALAIAEIAHAANIDLMIGAMMESRLGCATSAHLVAGIGGFHFIDLDTPMLLSHDPFTGGYAQSGMVYSLDPSSPGHGVLER